MPPFYLMGEPHIRSPAASDPDWRTPGWTSARRPLVTDHSGGVMLLTDMETGVRAVHRAPGRALAWRPDGLRGVKKGPSTGHVALAARLIAPPPCRCLQSAAEKWSNYRPNTVHSMETFRSPRSPRSLVSGEYPRDEAPGRRPAWRPVEDGTPQNISINYSGPSISGAVFSGAVFSGAASRDEVFRDAVFNGAVSGGAVFGGEVSSGAAFS